LVGIVDFDEIQYTIILEQILAFDHSRRLNFIWNQRKILFTETELLSSWDLCLPAEKRKLKQLRMSCVNHIFQYFLGFERRNCVVSHNA
jgi:hypothetical protein